MAATTFPVPQFSFLSLHDDQHPTHHPLSKQCSAFSPTPPPPSVISHYSLNDEHFAADDNLLILNDQNNDLSYESLSRTSSYSSCHCLEQGLEIMHSLSAHRDLLITTSRSSAMDKILFHAKTALAHAEVLLDCACNTDDEALQLAIAMVDQIVEVYRDLSRSINVRGGRGGRSRALAAAGKNSWGFKTNQADAVMVWLEDVVSDADSNDENDSGIDSEGAGNIANGTVGQTWDEGYGEKMMPPVQIGGYCLDQEESRFVVRRLLGFRLLKLRDLLRNIGRDDGGQ